MNYTFKEAEKQSIIDEDDYKILVKTAKSIYYPKRTYNKVLKDSNLESEKLKRLVNYLKVNKVDIKGKDAILVLNYVKNIQ